MKTNDFPALPGAAGGGRDSGGSSKHEERGFLDVVKGTGKMKLDSGECEGAGAEEVAAGQASTTASSAEESSHELTNHRLGNILVGKVNF